MADEKDNKPIYSQEFIDNALQYIVNPRERAEKKALLVAFGTTMLVLDQANWAVSEEVPGVIITEEDIEVMVAQIEEPIERERLRAVTKTVYKAFGVFYD